MKQIALGGYHSGVLLSNGKVVMFGRNDYRQCNISPAVQGKVTQITLGGLHSGLILANNICILNGFDGYIPFYDLMWYIWYKYYIQLIPLCFSNEFNCKSKWKMSYEVTKFWV